MQTVKHAVGIVLGLIFFGIIAVMAWAYLLPASPGNDASAWFIVLLAIPLCVVGVINALVTAAIKVPTGSGGRMVLILIYLAPLVLLAITFLIQIA